VALMHILAQHLGHYLNLILRIVIQTNNP